MTEEFRKSCGKCRFWDKESTTCRRHAPTPVFGKEVSVFIKSIDWPITLEADWCGEFEGVGKAGVWKGD